MHFDAEAESELPVPDHVPDDLTKRYGASARRTVRLSRSRGYPLVRALRRAHRTLREPDLWIVALTVFAWSVVAVGAVGALAYAIVMLPGAMTLIGLPLALLLAVSLAVATGLGRRRSGEPQTTTF